MQEKQKSKLKFIWQLVYIFGTLAVIYVLGFADPNFHTVSDNIKEFDANWLLAAFGAILVYWILQALLLGFIEKGVDAKISFLKNLKITIIGEYYSSITPFSTGGQPMQLGYFKRYGVPYSKSTIILMVRFIGFSASIGLLYIMSLLIYGGTLLSDITLGFWFTMLGFIINMSGIVFLVLLMVNKKLALTIGNFFINLICKFKAFSKRRQKMLDGFDKGVDDFSSAATFLVNNRSSIIGTILLSFLSVASFFSVSFFIFRAIGLSGGEYLVFMSMAVFLYLAVMFVPTPGALVAAESGYLLFFASLVPGTFIYLVMLVWRFFTYYLNLIVGAVIIIWDEVYYMLKRRNEKRTGIIAESSAQAEQDVLSSETENQCGADA